MKAIKEAVLSKDRENKATVARWFEGFWSSHWNLKIVLLVTILLTMVTPTQTLIAESCSLPAGSYEITARLELPHLERWGVDKTTIVCLPDTRKAGNIPVPVLSANNPFAKCSTANIMADGSNLEYDIICPERGAARGHAVYQLS
jgi:hypothetical protein